MPLFRVIQDWLVPPEAALIARQYRDAAKKVREIQKKIEKSKSYLDSNWVGKAQQAFMADLNGLPMEISGMADRLDQMADEIASFKVSVDIKQKFDEVLGWIKDE